MLCVTSAGRRGACKPKPRKTRCIGRFSPSSRKSTKQVLKKAHWQYIYGMLSTGLEKGDQKPFWCYIRSQMQDNQGVSPLLKGNQLQSDPATKGEILGQQFCSVITVNDPGSENIALEGPLYPMHEPHQSSQTLAYISSWRNSIQAKRQDQMRFQHG